jgi:signal transduction histidine kinase
VVYRYGAGELWDDPQFTFKPSRLKVGKQGMTGWVAATGEPLLAPDVRQEPHYVWMEGSRTLSELTMPILVKQRVVGVLDLQSDRLNAFDDTDRVVLQLLANQTGAALENARLFTAERRRAEQFRVITEVSRQITTAPNEQELFEQLAALVQSSFGYTNVGMGLVENGYVVSRVEVGAYARRYHGIRTPLGSGCWGLVAQSGAALLLNGPAEIAKYESEAAQAGVQSHLCVPMAFKESILGVLSAQSTAPYTFDESDQMVLQSLASQAAVALVNLRAQSRAQQLAVIEERNRLARELHDAVTQTLFSASLIAEALPVSWEHDPHEGQELLQELRALSRGALAEMRTLLLELRPAALAETNLADLLHQLAEAASGREGIPVQVQATGQASLPVDVHIALYRIAQEALNNVVKHARANQVLVRLCYAGSGEGQPEMPASDGAGLDCVLLSVKDDGCGFDATQARLNRLGLGIMHERAQAIGASLEIQSAPGQGTLVAVAWQPGEETATPSSS